MPKPGVPKFSLAMYPFSISIDERVPLKQDLQTFLSKGYISYYRTYRGPDVLRNVIVLGQGMLHSAKSTKFW